MSFAIYLGAGHSCVGVDLKHAMQILASDYGCRYTPSYVNFKEHERLVGELALEETIFDPKNTIYDAKRLILHDYNEKSVQDALDAFSIIDNDYLKIKVSFKGESMSYTQEEFFSKIFLKMKETIEAYLKAEITSAVITVPAYINNNEEQTFINAGKLAGFDKIFSLKEPTAATIAYEIRKKQMVGRTIMVFHLKKRALDVSIVSRTDTHFIIKSVSHNKDIGGQDFTNNIVNYFVDSFERKHKRKLRSSNSSLSRLQRECKNAIKRLTIQSHVNICIGSIMDGLNIDESITTETFNAINSRAFESTLITVKDALANNDMVPDDIDKIIMVGGSSRILYTQNLLSSFFGDKKILNSINLDEVIAIGASAFAAILNGIKINGIEKYQIQDFTVHWQRDNVNNNDKVSASISRNSRNSIMPISTFKKFVATHDRQTIRTFPISEGESEIRNTNTLLGKCTLHRFPPGLTGEEINMTSDIIGIDLGTTHSCVAVYENNRPEVLANKQGARTTPSWVTFSEDGKLIGEPAKEEAAFDPENTIYDMKRLIGRRYNDFTLKEIKHWPFTIDKDGEFTKVKVNWKGSVKYFKPEDISAIILTEMKGIAEERLDKKVTSAIVTVPAYFNDYQRQATIDAGKAAGLKSVRLLSESTAAALAYSVKNSDVRGTILVFDLGGGSLDVSVVNVTETSFEVKITNGNTHLGGEDFTNRLFDYMDSICLKKCGKSIANHKSAVARMKRECEIAKKRLSNVLNVKISIHSLIDGKHFNEEITRDKFCELNQDLFKLILQPIKDALQSINMEKKDINKIIMVGGSSRIPKIRDTLSRFFHNKEILTSINPDEAIACGAAIYAAMQDDNEDNEDTHNFTAERVTQRSLGLGWGTNFEKTHFMIEKKSPIPICKNGVFITAEDNQTSLTVKVYEGDSLQTKDNTLLGEFTITDVAPKPKGKVALNVQFSVDVSGTLTVSAYNI